MAARPLRVMIAEDNPVNQTLLRGLLESMGHVATLAEHGAQALELAATQDFDLVLMDVQMPVMDGLTATRLIRMLPGERAHVPVVALTADPVGDHGEYCSAAGLNAVLNKPISPAMLSLALHRLTGNALPPSISDGATPAPSPTAPPDPALDLAYVEDLRQWVGDATVQTLLAAAPASFRDELAAVTAGWETGDLRRVRENAHRLKGAAGSVGCRRLAEMAQAIQKIGAQDLGDRSPLDRLAAEVAAAAAAAEAWRPG